jgi:hypothetical protein
MVPTGFGQWRRTVSRVDGLRFGANRLMVVAHDGRRRADVEERTISVSRDRPLAGPRAPRRAAVSGVAVLDAAASVPGRGGTLRFRWKLLGAPRGSKRAIAGATSRRARLVPDRPGA